MSQVRRDTAATARLDRYDTIGVDYSRRRREEPSWAREILAALGDATSVVNVGAGTGNYEPHDRLVVAVEPSATMLDQRPSSSATAIRGGAEALPFADDAFDVALAILTVHHWSDPHAGLGELARVANRQVIVSWDREATCAFWLCRDYLPEIQSHVAGQSAVEDVATVLDVHEVRPLLVPRDCVDGFMGADWARPEAYLDPSARGAMSGLALLDQDVVDVAMARLAHDVADGTWHERNAELAGLDAFDAGFRLVVAGRPTSRG
jgi:SAM-dependent methyltransferase